jgi:hypothetical protein
MVGLGRYAPLGFRQVCKLRYGSRGDVRLGHVCMVWRGSLGVVRRGEISFGNVWLGRAVEVGSVLESLGEMGLGRAV